MLLSSLLQLTALSPLVVTAPPDRWFAITPTVGAHVRLDDWDLNESLTSRDLPSAVAPYLGVRFSGGPLWYLGFEGAVGSIIYQSEAGSTNVALQYDADLFFIFTRHDWAPLFLLGGGGLQNVSGDHGSDFDVQFHYGAGVRGMLTDLLALRFEVRHLMTDTSDVDSSVANNLEILVGLDVFVHRSEAAPPIVDGDADGVPDASDRCPDQPGSSKYSGCPDSDQDGVPDPDDKCPSVHGPSALQGCPDEDPDRDGVRASDDECPSVAGLPTLNGCPDSDADGVADGKDRCPNEAGPAALRGCPDGDGDGVPDIDDRCPTQRGPIELNGCEPQFDGALEGITFARNSADITAESRAVLNAVVDKLKRFETLEVSIEGHTDDRAGDAYNQRLSLARARAVRDYLVGQGIESARLDVRGFGESKPVAPNDSDDGRARNRRIEFHVKGK